MYLDCGHIAQNLALCASTLGLGSCQVGAFYDDEINKIVGLDGEEESVIYLSVVGYPTWKFDSNILCAHFICTSRTETTFRTDRTKRN